MVKVKRNFQSVVLKLLALLRFLKRREKQEESLKNRIKQQHSIGKNINISLYKSGRSGLHAIISEAVENYACKEIYLPYRVCNILKEIAENNHLEPHFYDLNKLFNQDLQFNRKEDIGSPVIFVVTSIWGIDLLSKGTVDFIKGNLGKNTIIIFDECQSPALANYFDSEILSYCYAVLYSLNDKTLPGYMGGIVFSKNKFEINFLTIREEIMFLLHYLKDLLRFIISSPISEIKGEYSFFNSFIYQIDKKRMSLISLSIANLVFKKIQQIRRLRKKNIEVLKSFFDFKKINNLNHAFIPHEAIQINHLEKKSYPLIKGPYLIHAEESLKESLADKGKLCFKNSFNYKYLKISDEKTTNA